MGPACSAPSERLVGLARLLGAQAPIGALLMCQLSRAAGIMSCNTRQKSAYKHAQRPDIHRVCPVLQDAREQQAQRHRQGMHGMGQQQGGPPPSTGLQPSSGSGAHSRNSSFSGPNGSGILPRPQGGAMNGILLGGGGLPPPVLQHSTSARLGAVGAFGGGYGSVESSLASLGSLGGPAGLVRLGAGGGVQQQHPAARYPVTSSVAGSESEWGGAGGPADPRPQQWQALQRAASGGVMASAVGMNVMARDFASQHQHLQQQSQQQHRRQQQQAQQMANGSGRPSMYNPMGHDASLGATIACVGYL